MKTVLSALPQLLQQETIDAAKQAVPAGSPIYDQSLTQVGDSLLMTVKGETEKFLVQAATIKQNLQGDFEGEICEESGFAAKRIALTATNADALRAALPWTAPVSLRERRTTIGFGDRMGRATAGHIRAARQYQLAPVLAQQSIRELTLTNRDYPTVVNDATFLVFQEGYDLGYGADGDHLKTIADIDVALAAGMPMITLDLTEVLHPEAEHFSDVEVDAAFAKLPADFQQHVLAEFADKTFSIVDEEIHFPTIEAKRCAVMYVDALQFTPEVYEHLKANRGDAFDLELSIDETTTPTLPAHHLFIAAELKRSGVILSSLAPRFIGDFQKGIDYIGDLAEFERQFATHCKISKCYGLYKISVHSGSDKFSAFPIVGKHTDHRLHLKTAGTSWLEGMRALSMVDPDLYREMHRAANAGLAHALTLYHITADFDKVPALESLSDDQLPSLYADDMIEARQLIHITYGHLLTHPELSERFFQAIHQHDEVYYDCLIKHFGRHFEALGLPKA